MIKITHSLIVFLGLAAMVASQLAAPIALSGINARHGGYLGGVGAAYPNVLGGYQNIGVDPYYGGYPTSNYGRVPISLNGAVPLGYAGQGYGGLATGHGYAGLATGHGYAGLAAGHGYPGLTTVHGYAGLTTGYGGYGVPAHGGLALAQGGIPLNKGLAVNGGILPYGGLGSSSKQTLTSNEVVINHGGVGASRQWVQRFDKN